VITKEQAMAAAGRTLYHVNFTNKDGTPLRARPTGKCKTWKRDPERWQLPVKVGSKTHSRIDNLGAVSWCLTAEEVQMYRNDEKLGA
jgi:hypothetical protein